MLHEHTPGLFFLGLGEVSKVPSSRELSKSALNASKHAPGDDVNFVVPRGSGRLQLYTNLKQLKLQDSLVGSFWDLPGSDK